METGKMFLDSNENFLDILSRYQIVFPSNLYTRHIFNIQGWEIQKGNQIRKIDYNNSRRWQSSSSDCKILKLFSFLNFYTRCILNSQGWEKPKVKSMYDYNHPLKLLYSIFLIWFPNYCIFQNHFSLVITFVRMLRICLNVHIELAEMQVFSVSINRKKKI